MIVIIFLGYYLGAFMDNLFGLKLSLTIFFPVFQLSFLFIFFIKKSPKKSCKFFKKQTD
ncbi:MAG: hypothetical protein ISR02_01740 [Flavobacteriales bacterium]|nr:hypothetical protein [Flavobacteriales bacterium]